MRDEVAPNWMDKTGFGVVGRFTLDDGEQVIAEIVDFNEEANEIIVQATPTVGSDKSVEQSTRGIAVDCVLAFDPEPRSLHAWPHSDPCRNRSFSGSRFALMTTLFLSSIVGSLALFITLMNDAPCRLQELSALSYTLSVVFATFAALREAPPYMFSCPAVRSQIPRLLRRHAGFLLALFLLQTVALTIRPSLPAWWSLRDLKGETPFELVLLFMCFGLGFIQIFTNRSLLKRAHSDFNG